MFDGKENVTVKLILVDEMRVTPHSVTTPDGEWKENESQPIAGSIVVCSTTSAMNAAQEIVKGYQAEIRTVPDHRAMIIVQNAATNKEIGRVWSGSRTLSPTPDESFAKAQKLRDDDENTERQRLEAEEKSYGDTVLDPRD